MTTKAQALDHLTDVLAGEDVAGEPTVAGAIDKLATMIEDGDISIGGGGGGGGVVEIPFELDAETQEPVCTKTADEIFAIIDSGKSVVGVLGTSDTVKSWYALSATAIAQSSKVVTFNGLMYSNDTVTYMELQVTNVGTNAVMKDL